MDTRKFLLILTVVIAVYVTVSSATQSPVEEHDNKAVQLADESQPPNSDKNADDTPSTEGKKSKPKRKHHGKNKNHRNNHPRPRSHGGRNRTRNHHKNHRHGSKDKSKKNPSVTPLPHEDTSVKANTGENKRQERNHNNKKEKNNKNRSRSREGRNRNHNERDHPSSHPIQNDASSTSINDPVEVESIYQAQNYNHNLVGHSTKTSVKHEPTKATGPGSTTSN